ncbi:hypothetical protein DLJ74_00245 [Gracilibacillus dipsosauri]|uniref:Uncharacterized protein n=1 Tax=Gracilibacillus dipsosauri TaxID=178340 RepID=A0A317L912_9BACI|nr:hypothetical protein DLJ74_00245 [Gracilibacillus dipsosauri]
MTFTTKIKSILPEKASKMTVTTRIPDIQAKRTISSREQMTPTAQDCLVFCKKVKMIPLLLKMFSC